MVILISILHIIVSLFLIAVILLQAGRGQGLSWGVFGGSPQSIFGTRTATFLTRVTTVCAGLFLVTCISLNVIETTKSRSLLSPTSPQTKVDIQKIKEELEAAAKQAVSDQTKPAEAKAVVENVAASAVTKEVPATPATPAAAPAKTE